MFIAELFEETKRRLVVVYAGRFQPFHKGHKAVYDYLVNKYGRDTVFIASSNNVELPKSPFSFSDKTKFMAATGVPLDRVIETTQPYKAVELNPDPANTVMVFAVSQKDMETDPRFKFTKKDGSPAHFQPLPKDLKTAVTSDQHSYIEVVPTFDFTVLGHPVRSATQIREMYKKSDNDTKKKIIADLFGTYSNELKNVMDNALHENSNMPVAADSTSPVGGTVSEDASGYIPKNSKEAKDPRWSHALTVDVKPDTPKKNIAAFFPTKAPKSQLKQVTESIIFQGYRIDLDPVNKMLIVSKQGKVLHREYTKLALRNPNDTKVKARLSTIIDQLEDEKYPDDLEARYVDRPFGEQREPYQSAIDRLEAHRIADLQDRILEIKERLASEQLSPEHRESLLNQIKKMTSEIKGYLSAK